MPKLNFKKSLKAFVENNPPNRETKLIEKETDELFL